MEDWSLLGLVAQDGSKPEDRKMQLNDLSEQTAVIYRKLSWLMSKEIQESESAWGAMERMKAEMAGMKKEVGDLKKQLDEVKAAVYGGLKEAKKEEEGSKKQEEGVKQMQSE